MNIKSLGFICILLFFTKSGSAQGYNNLWLMGYENYNPLPWGGTNIDFYTGQAYAYFEPSRTMEFAGTVVNVTDSLGQLLFYSNGAWIANKNHQQMLNGGNLNPSFYTANRYTMGLNLFGSHIVLRMPSNDSLYYMIHQTYNNQWPRWPSWCYYSIINMNGDGGNGEVIIKNQKFLIDTLTFQMSACKHANGRDWWIIIPEAPANPNSVVAPVPAVSPGYYIYLLTPTGLQFVMKQTIGIRWCWSGVQATFSRDGSLYAQYDPLNGLEVFDFDRCNGTFSNPRHVAINDSVIGNGVSISPNNRFVYASSAYYLYQLDLQNLQNYQTIAVWDSFYDGGPPFSTLFYTQELMPDNKIYINTGNGTRYLHVIDYPDSLGTACHVRQHGYQLPTYNFQSTPYYPNVFLGPVVGSICDSLSVGLTENSIQTANLHLSPNPATNQVWVNYHFPNNKDGWLELYNNVGQLVLKQRLYWSTTQQLIYLDELMSSGVYIARVYDDTYKFADSKKLVISSN